MSVTIAFTYEKIMSERNEFCGRHSERHEKALVKIIAVCLDEVKRCDSWETVNDINKLLCKKRFFLHDFRDCVETLNDSQKLTRAVF